MELKFYDCFYDKSVSCESAPHVQAYKYDKDWSGKMYFLIGTYVKFRDSCVVCSFRGRLWN